MKDLLVGTRVERRAERQALSQNSTRAVQTLSGLARLCQMHLWDMFISSGPNGRLPPPPPRW